jgi:hypothetical protein
MSTERRPVRDFWLHVGGPRAADFERVYGTTIIAVTSPIAHMAGLPGFDEPQEVYLLDLDWLDEIGRRENLIAFIAERFGQDPAEVAQGLDEEGMPILATDTTLRIEHPQRWLT